MIFQEFYYQDKSNYQRSRLDAALRGWKAGSWDTFVSAQEESFSQYTALGWLISEAQESFLPDTQNIQKEQSTPEHNSWRKDIEWTPDLTEGIAEVRAKRSDRLANLNFKRANVDFWSLPNLSGVLLGAMGSPENLVAWGGMLGRAGAIASAGAKVGISQKYFAPIAQGMADAAVADALFQSVKAAVQINRGQSPDLVHAGFELGLATISGGVIGSFPMASQVAQKVPNAFKPVLIKKAWKDMSEGRGFGYFKNKGKRQTAEEIDPNTTAEEINARIKGYEDNNEKLRQDASKQSGKDYINHSVGQVKGIIHKVANCVRGNMK